ncbi:MAG: hypothetical protein Q7U14_07255, partial [Lacisediminimonas sp.]|nr:hypothetical protein [Lacisediminimonas sp.]
HHVPDGPVPANRHGAGQLVLRLIPSFFRVRGVSGTPCLAPCFLRTAMTISGDNHETHDD